MSEDGKETFLVNFSEMDDAIEKLLVSLVEQDKERTIPKRHLKKKLNVDLIKKLLVETIELQQKSKKRNEENKRYNYKDDKNNNDSVSTTISEDVEARLKVSIDNDNDDLSNDDKDSNVIDSDASNDENK